MEEILATIRRIIAEDEQASGTARRGVPAGTFNGRDESGPRETMRAAREPDGAGDILDLTEALNEDGSVRRLAPIGGVSGASEPAPAPSSAGAASLAINSTGASETITEPARASPAIDRPAPAEAGARPDRAADPTSSSRAPQSPAAGDGRLVSDAAALAAATAFGRLPVVPRGSREPPLVDGRPLDDLVRELLRPLLQSWLDENLPGIVERLVQAEIARISARSNPG